MATARNDLIDSKTSSISRWFKRRRHRLRPLQRSPQAHHTTNDILHIQPAVTETSYLPSFYWYAACLLRPIVYLLIGWLRAGGIRPVLRDRCAPCGRFSTNHRASSYRILGITEPSFEILLNVLRWLKKIILSNKKKKKKKKGTVVLLSFCGCCLNSKWRQMDWRQVQARLNFIRFLDWFGTNKQQKENGAR